MLWFVVYWHQVAFLLRKVSGHLLHMLVLLQQLLGIWLIVYRVNHCRCCYFFRWVKIDGKLTASVLGLDFNDTHSTPLLTGFDLGYFVNDNLEVFGGFQYVRAGGRSTKALDISAAGNFTDSAGTVTSIAATETAVNAKFENYKSWALKVGATKYFPMESFIPYVGGYRLKVEN